MTRKLALYAARTGWALADDLRALLLTLAAAALVTAPLLAWRLATQRLLADMVPFLPSTVVVGSLTLAAALSALLLYRLGRVLIGRAS